MAGLAAFIEPSAVVSLESHMDRIALEANFLANMLETFKKVIPDFSLKLKEVDGRIQALFAKTEELRSDFSRKQKKAIDVSKKLDFLTFGERLVTVPESFSGNLVQYSKLLNRIVPIVYAGQRAALLEYSTILSSFLTNKEDKISIKDHTNFFIRLRKEREEISHSLQQYFPKNTNISRIRMKNILSRMADLEVIAHEANKLSSTQTSFTIKEVHTATEQCVSLLDLIIQNVQEGKVENISSNATLNISTGAFEVGKYLEMVATLYYDVLVYLNCIDQLMETFVDSQ